MFKILDKSGVSIISKIFLFYIYSFHNPISSGKEKIVTSD